MPDVDPLQAAIQQYPYLADKGIQLVQSPAESGGGNMLEFWRPGEPGDEKYKRPSSIPLDSVGIELFGDKAGPLDILGDYVSHHAVNTDPVLQRLYKQFQTATPPEMMMKRYQYHKQNLGENRDFNTWAVESGIPELFRGYTFNQFGPNGASIYSPDQIKVLNDVRGYLGIK